MNNFAWPAVDKVHQLSKFRSSSNRIQDMIAKEDTSSFYIKYHGTFNPMTVGHLECLQQAYNFLRRKIHPNTKIFIVVFANSIKHAIKKATQKFAEKDEDFKGYIRKYLETFILNEEKQFEVIHATISSLSLTGIDSAYVVPSTESISVDAMLKTRWTTDKKWTLNGIDDMVKKIKEIGSKNLVVCDRDPKTTEEETDFDRVRQAVLQHPKQSKLVSGYKGISSSAIRLSWESKSGEWRHMVVNNAVKLLNETATKAKSLYYELRLVNTDQKKSLRNTPTTSRSSDVMMKTSNGQITVSNNDKIKVLFPADASETGDMFHLVKIMNGNFMGAEGFLNRKYIK